MTDPPPTPAPPLTTTTPKPIEWCKISVVKSCLSVDDPHPSTFSGLKYNTYEYDQFVAVKHSCLKDEHQVGVTATWGIRSGSETIVAYCDEAKIYSKIGCQHVLGNTPDGNFIVTGFAHLKAPEKYFTSIAAVASSFYPLLMAVSAKCPYNCLIEPCSCVLSMYILLSSWCRRLVIYIQVLLSISLLSSYLYLALWYFMVATL